MTLFDKYQSKENGKHVMRAVKENLSRYDKAIRTAGFQAIRLRVCATDTTNVT